MSGHATASCQRITVGIHPDVENAVLLVLIDVRMVTMRFRLRRVVVG